MKKLIIAVVLVLVIGGGAVGVLMWLEIGPFAKQPAADAGEGTASKEVALKAPPKFIDVSPLIIPIFQGDKVAGTIDILIKLEAESDENVSTIKHLMPRLNDGFLRALYTLIPQLLKTEQRIDVDTVKRRLMSVGEQVAGRGVIANVLIQSMNDSQSN
jgi:flagellar basal body-associated protein FliL